MLSNAIRPPRVIFLGMPCAFAVPPLRALLTAGMDVRAIVIPMPAHLVSPADHLVALAHQANVPVLAAPDLGATAAVAAIVAHQPDVLVAACWPRRLPATLLRLAPHGVLNVHPSLLPLGRGPEPVFWALRRGERETGATVHLMDAGLDTGPILGQTRITVPEGIRAPDLEHHLAELGGALAVTAITDLIAGTASPRPQDDAAATVAPIPSAADFLVPTNLPARWAYNFIRGVAPLGGPLSLLVMTTGQRIPVRDAVVYSADGRQEQAVIADGNRLVVPCAPGTVTVIPGD